MVIPDKLVEAVTQALYDADPSWNTISARREIAAIAIKATLAALPECEEVEVMLRNALHRDPTARYEGMGNSSIDLRSAHMSVMAALGSLGQD